MIGQRIGKNDVKNASQFYTSFRWFTLLLIGLVITFQFQYRETIVGLYTKDEDVKNAALHIIWLINFNTFPDLYKGMLKGLIGALALQKKAMWINLVC